MILHLPQQSERRGELSAPAAAANHTAIGARGGLLTALELFQHVLRPRNVNILSLKRPDPLENARVPAPFGPSSTCLPASYPTETP